MADAFCEKLFLIFLHSIFSTFASLPYHPYSPFDSFSILIVESFSTPIFLSSLYLRSYGSLVLHGTTILQRLESMRIMAFNKDSTYRYIFSFIFHRSLLFSYLYNSYKIDITTVQYFYFNIFPLFQIVLFNTSRMELCFTRKIYF